MRLCLSSISPFPLRPVSLSTTTWRVEKWKVGQEGENNTTLLTYSWWFHHWIFKFLYIYFFIFKWKLYETLKLPLNFTSSVIEFRLFLESMFWQTSRMGPGTGLYNTYMWVGGEWRWWSWNLESSLEVWTSVSLDLWGQNLTQNDGSGWNFSQSPGRTQSNEYTMWAININHVCNFKFSRSHILKTFLTLLKRIRWN